LEIYLFVLCVTFAGVRPSPKHNYYFKSNYFEPNSVFIVNNITATNPEVKALNAWAVGDGGTIIGWTGTT
jgi:hypothetical protein